MNRGSLKIDFHIDQTHYYQHKIYVGERSIEDIRYGFWSRHLVCPECMVCWVSLIPQYPHSDFSGIATCEHCSKVNEVNSIPGSLLTNSFCDRWTDWTLLSKLPFGLLQRELFLHLKAFDHDLSNSGNSPCTTHSLPTAITSPSATLSL